jgi:hypothetical protein
MAALEVVGLSRNSAAPSPISLTTPIADLPNFRLFSFF